MFNFFKPKEQPKRSKEDEEKLEQLVTDLTSLKMIVGLNRTEREIINKAIDYIEKGTIK